MNLDNMMLHQLYDMLDDVIEGRRLIRQYHKAPQGRSVEECLQELDEEEICIRARIEELSIAQEDYFSNEL